jgi:hypothetical protein
MDQSIHAAYKLVDATQAVCNSMKKDMKEFYQEL